MTADVDLYVREGSRFVRVADARPARPVPPIPTPVRVAADEPYRPHRVAVDGRLPSCGRHIAAWAVYTDPSGRPACKLCDTPRRTR